MIRREITMKMQFIPTWIALTFAIKIGNFEVHQREEKKNQGNGLYLYSQSK